MSTSQIRWGKLTRVSKDKGPYKLATASVDGVDREFKVLDVSGVQTNPMKDSQVMLICPDGDEGRMFGIVIPPPAQRTDGLKEGESVFTNHKDGQFIKMSEGGHIEEKAKGNKTTEVDGTITVKSGGVLHLNPP